MDMLKWVIDTYEKELTKFFEGEKNLTVSFFADSDELVDEIIKEEKNCINYFQFNIKILQDYSIKEEENNSISDINYCTVDNYKFIKIVTPFTMERAYDFLIGKSSEMEEILRILKIRESKKNFNYNNNFPIIGFNFDEIESETIKFLMNEDFRKYCSSKYIKLKRGIILQGGPGTGKTMTLQWLRNKAGENGISYRQFKDVKEFLEDVDDYYSKGKKIFVFEDFDAALMERENTGKTPNQILGKVLNTLEGVEEINDVVSIFTTNNINVFDSAFIRPGRIDKVINYDLPTKKEYLEFFEAYIPDEKEYFVRMVEHLEFLNTDVSYAILKGICDDINIYKFSGKELTIEKIINIIKEKVTGANKNKEVKKITDFTL